MPEKPIFETGQRVRIAATCPDVKLPLYVKTTGVVLYMMRDALGNPSEWVAVRWHNAFTREHHADDLELIP